MSVLLPGGPLNPLPNLCRVKIKNGTQSKRCEIDRLFIKSFTQNFKKRYHYKRKESQGSNPKNCLLEKAPEEKSHKDMSLCESFDFSEGVFRVAKIAFSLERLYGRIFLTLGEHYFQGFFPSVFFS